ncbi:hypothetical protein [Bacteroides faecalis]|uniref:Uncharacterized protein n=1 Tax=Bacteroides faecalis TaxID=2447885 RepID=A0A401LSR8_9BACE|nr:hypothetical protein [Bacteroides faecalis]GCB34606.1 hypothetical protein KGMB02408_15510 [Bacteroides faecalis]GCB34683.1 hypothetical protein KGMB02408_16280 [Bacteroides faecalis]
MKTIIGKTVEGFENAIISENKESWFVDIRTGLEEAEYPKVIFTLEQIIEASGRFVTCPFLNCDKLSIMKRVTI